MENDEFSRRQNHLDRVRQQSEEVNREIERYFDYLYQEFLQHYPPLVEVDEVYLSQDVMAKWVDPKRKV